MTARGGILVLSSTYPRWRDDSLPSFVHELCKNLLPFSKVTVLAPHCAGAKSKEVMDEVDVIRYRYAPERFETLAYGSGIVNSLLAKWYKLILIPPLLLSQLVYAIALIRKHDIKVVHCHWLIPQGLVGFLLKLIFRSSLRVVVTCHGSDITQINGRGMIALKKIIAKNVDEVVVVGEELRRVFEREYGISAEVLPMGVSIGQVEAAEFGQSYILYVGRLELDKGVLTLVEAYRLAVMAGLKSVLYLAGAGTMESCVRDFVCKHGLEDKVFLLGAQHRDRVLQLMGKSEIVVVPSKHEGLGLVFIESLLVRGRVLASNLAVFKWGARGWDDMPVFDPESPQELSLCMLRAQENDDYACVDSGVREVVSDFFSWKRVALDYSKVLGV